MLVFSPIGILFTNAANASIEESVYISLFSNFSSLVSVSPWRLNSCFSDSFAIVYFSFFSANSFYRCLYASLFVRKD